MFDDFESWVLRLTYFFLMGLTILGILSFCFSFLILGLTILGLFKDSLIFFPGLLEGKTPRKGHRDYLRSVAYSPDGSRLISGSDDRTIKIWNVSTGQCLQTLTGHTDYVWEVSYRPDGKRIASGSFDETIKIWDADTGKCLTTLTGHSDVVDSVAYSPSGKSLASGSDDYTIRLWDIHSHAQSSNRSNPKGTRPISQRKIGKLVEAFV